MKNYFIIIWGYIKFSVKVFWLLKKGQKTKYNLLQLSHRLEKGLSIRDPKPLWGWDKAWRIFRLLKSSDDVYATNTATAVLSAYIKAKSHSTYPEDLKLVDKFLRVTGFTPVVYDGIGGVQEIYAEKFSQEEIKVVEKLFSSRHSAREFSERPVTKEIIYRAVDMAQRCPSACNRQPYKCYVIDPEIRRTKLPSFTDYKADKYLIITGDIRAFVTTELYDWVVSPVIFASYLTLSLHVLGVGSCVLKKQLVSETEYSYNFRKLFDIDESETIVLEMAIGYYKERFIVPVSNRDSAEDIVKFIL